MMARYKSEDEYTPADHRCVQRVRRSGNPHRRVEAADRVRCAAQHCALCLQALREHNLLQAIARVNRLYEEDGDREAVRLHHRL